MPREEYVRVQERFYPHPPTPATPVFALGQPRVCAEQTGKEEQSPLWQAGDGQLESNGGRRIEAFFLLWRKAWAAGREPEAADITIILGSGL